MPGNDTGTPEAQLPTPASSPPPDCLASDGGMSETMRLSQSRGADVLDQYFPIATNGMYFQTLQAANSVMNNAQWRPPYPDSTIPQTAKDDRLVVEQLVDAFLDLASATDTQGNAYRKRFTPGLRVCYARWVVENCAWHVLRDVKSLHINGFKAPIFDLSTLQCIGQTANWTFAERLHAICLVLKTSKSIAVTLMKWEKTWTIIGAPHKLYSSTMINTQSNAKRNFWVKVGRQADPNHARATSPMFSVHSATPVDPAKRKKTPVYASTASSAIVANQSLSATAGPFGIIPASPTPSLASSSSSPKTANTIDIGIADNDVKMVDCGLANRNNIDSVKNEPENAEAKVKTENEIDNDISMADTDNLNIAITLATPQDQPARAAEGMPGHTPAELEAAEIMAFLRGVIYPKKP